MSGPGALRQCCRGEYVPKREDEDFWLVHLCHAVYCVKTMEYIEAATEGLMKVRKVIEREDEH